MNVKKIEFVGLTSTSISYTALGGIRFYDSANSIISSGSIITNNKTNGETQNFILTATNSSDSYAYVTYAFDTSKKDIASSYSYNYWMGGTNDNQTISCEFKTPKKIKKITFNTRPEQTNRGIDTPFKINAYNENGKLIYSYNVTPSSTSLNNIQTLETPQLNVVSNILLKANNKVYSLKSKELLQLTNDRVQNFINHGASSIVNFNIVYSSKNYILQDTVSENADGLWVQELNRKPLSIKFE